MQQAVFETTEPDVPVAASAPNQRGLRFVSYSLASNPSLKDATLKVEVDGEIKTFSHAGGVGPVDVMCTALKDLIPDFSLVHCRTEEARPGSDAPAKAQVVLEWGELMFEGSAEDPDTLNATAMAVIDALAKLRPIRIFTGGRLPVVVEGFWAGRLVENDRGAGSKSFCLFALEEKGDSYRFAFKRECAGKEKKALAKRLHHLHEIHSVAGMTVAGDSCEYFVPSRYS